MIHFTELQTIILLAGSATILTLAVWALLVAIPNRNETIHFLKDRNQTLEYWINNVTAEKNPAPWVPLNGSLAQNKMENLLLLHKFLNDQLRRCLIDIEHCKQDIETSKKSGHES